MGGGRFLRLGGLRRLLGLVLGGSVRGVVGVRLLLGRFGRGLVGESQHLALRLGERRVDRDGGAHGAAPGAVLGQNIFQGIWLVTDVLDEGLYILQVVLVLFFIVIVTLAHKRLLGGWGK